uniref:Uncharacterized protein n=1 Tax=Spermophilus dauricus TaxID=99837 RepID=A0A8C9Q1W1_SPEDA
VPFSSALHHPAGFIIKELVLVSRSFWVRQTPTPAVHPIQMCLWRRTGRQCAEKLNDRPRHSWKKQRDEMV